MGLVCAVTDENIQNPCILIEYGEIGKFINSNNSFFDITLGFIETDKLPKNKNVYFEIYIVNLGGNNYGKYNSFNERYEIKLKKLVGVIPYESAGKYHKELMGLFLQYN